tara:strand:+ start:107 stop:742 length:636 start_codon:yes stop_codon:yes gene_type:complete
MTLTINKINQQLTKHVKENLKWDDLNTGSNTQNGEQSYIRDIINIIHLMGGKIGSLAASQKPKDIQDVLFPSVSHSITYECKKSTSGKYILNDTIPKKDDDYYYVFINVKERDVEIKHSSFMLKKITNNDHYIEEEQKSLFANAIECSYKMLNNNRSAESYRQLYDIMIHIQKNAVKMGDIELADYGQMFKQASDFGIVKSRPRPNWSIKI